MPDEPIPIDAIMSELNSQWNASNVTKPTSRATFGKYSPPQELDMSMESKRNQPDILNAFRSNPYTQRLNTSV